tara:strand:- start:12 stop:194 length:183 start_codon:yes stop_codon:yes gene_type:complete
VTSFLLLWNILDNFFGGIDYPLKDLANLSYFLPFALIVLTILLVEERKKIENTNDKNPET